MKLICLEGIAGSGKSSLAPLLRDYLVKQLGEPISLICELSAFSPLREEITRWRTDS